jgi:hypothetical protein
MISLKNLVGLSVLSNESHCVVEWKSFFIITAQELRHVS